MTKNLEKNNLGLITRVVTDGDLPTTSDTYALNCELITEQTVGEDV